MSCASPMWGVASILGVLLVVSPRAPLFAGPSLRQRADREAKPRRRTERDRGPYILLRGPSAAGSENPPIPLVAGESGVPRDRRQTANSSRDTLLPCAASPS